MDDRYKGGGFLLIVGLLVLVSNFRQGAPIFSFEMMPDNPHTQGSPVPYIVSWAFGASSFVLGALISGGVLPVASTVRRYLLACAIGVVILTLISVL